MPIQAADLDTVFEALLDRTAFLLARTVVYKETVYATAGAFNHVFQPLGLLAEVIVVGGGGGGGGGFSGATVGDFAGNGGAGGSSGRWTRANWAFPYGGLTGFVGDGGTGGLEGTAATPGGDGQASWVKGSDPSRVYQYVEALGGSGGFPGATGIGVMATAGGVGIVPHRGEGIAYGGRGGKVGGGAGNGAATGESGFNATGGPHGVGGGIGGMGSGGIGMGAGGGGGRGIGSDVASGGGGGGGGVDAGDPAFFRQGAPGVLNTGGKGAVGGVIVREYYAATA